MDSPTPSIAPYHRSPEPGRRSKSASRLAPALDDDDPVDTRTDPVAATPPLTEKCPISPSPLHLSVQNPSPVSLQELLLLSPSPRRRPRHRLVGDDAADAAPRRKGKSKTAAAAAAAGLIGCGSPRNVRRARRRLEKEIAREERELGLLEDDAGRVRKRRQSRTRAASKEKLSLVPALPSPGPPPDITNEDGPGSQDGLWEMISELIMWKNVAKSTLWFGLGSIFLLSSSFSRNVNFSVISAMSHLGILILGLAFFRDSVPQRQKLNWRGKFQLTEDDVLHAARVILPMANAALAKAQEIFSGEPSMTLKVSPILLFGAKYGHLITMWRLLATGFFLSFTAPKLFSCYSQQIHSRVEKTRISVQEAWKSCPRKKFVAASTATVFWNLFSVKTRILAAFLSLVILRYQHQQQQHHHAGDQENGQSESREMDQEQVNEVVPVAEEKTHMMQLG